MTMKKEYVVQTVKVGNGWRREYLVTQVKGGGVQKFSRLEQELKRRCQNQDRLNQSPFASLRMKEENYNELEKVAKELEIPLVGDVNGNKKEEK